MVNIHYVGLNAYQQCPQKGENILQKVLTKWEKFSLKSATEIVCTFKNVVIKTDNSFIIYGVTNEKCNDNCRTLSVHDPVDVFLATDNFLIITKNNRLWKSEYTNSWLEITCSFSKDQEAILWSNKIIIKLSFLLVNQDIIVLLSDGSVWQMDSKYRLTTVYSPHLDKAVDITCGFEHALILTESGCVFTFGNGSRGQLGHGDLLPSEEALQVLGLGGLQVIRIAAGGWHSCAVTDSGDLYMWGWNNFGQLTQIKDSSVSEDGYGVAALPMLVDIDQNTEKIVKDIACGTRHTVVVTDHNELFVTGWNEYGQLGINDPGINKVNKFTKSGLQLGKGKKLLLCGPWSTLLYDKES